MNSQQHFRLKMSHQAVLLAMAAVWPAVGYGAAAGRADFVIGEVVAVAPDGVRRPLTRGASINAGDTIHTGGRARAQIRFVDGGYVSLQPDTQFRVDEYHYENKTDGKEKGFFSLLKGGLRAITGAIGRTNRSAYRVSAKAATIGIRGTGFNLEQQGEGLLVNVGEGAISLTNNTGVLVVSAGEGAYVANANTPPEYTFHRPNTPPAGLLAPTLETTFISGDARTSINGDARTSINGDAQTLTSGPGYVMAYAYVSSFSYLSNSAFLNNVTADFTASSQLIQYNNGTEGGALGTAQVSFSATDGIIGWGRWNGGTTANIAGSVHPLDLAGGDTFHYVVGIPTPATDFAALNRVTATYSLIGGTQPTSSLAGLGNLDDGTLTANFGSNTVDASLQLSFPGVGSYNVSSFSMQLNPATSTFGGNLSIAGPSSCFSACSGNVSGFFAGANAARAGVAYSFEDFEDGDIIGNVTGVAAFTQSSTASGG